MAAYGYIRRGTLGIDPKTGDRAKFPQLQYFTSKLIIVLSSSLFSLTIKNFSQIFACDFNGEDPSNWKPVLRDDLVCYSGKHAFYSGISGALFFTYHLSATTLFPNFQFDEPSLDIKFTSTYIILKLQTEVLRDFSGVVLVGKGKWFIFR